MMLMHQIFGFQRQQSEMHNMKKLITVIIVTLVACNKGVIPTPPTPPTPVVDMCHLACENLKVLHCEEGNAIHMGIECESDAGCSQGEICRNNSCWTTCAEFCRDTLETGVQLEPECVSKVTSCDMIDTCPLTQEH